MNKGLFKPEFKKALTQNCFFIISWTPGICKHDCGEERGEGGRRVVLGWGWGYGGGGLEVWGGLAGAWLGMRWPSWAFRPNES